MDVVALCPKDSGDECARDKFDLEQQFYLFAPQKAERVLRCQGKSSIASSPCREMQGLGTCHSEQPQGRKEGIPFECCAGEVNAGKSLESISQIEPEIRVT